MRIARALAGAGFPSLRFDLSGLGDTPPARHALGYEEQSIQDISAAMDWIAAHYDMDAAIPIGMCSGADNAYRAAQVDERIAGAVLMDPYAYAAPGGHVDRIAKRVANPDWWAQKFSTARAPSRAEPEAPPNLSAHDEDGNDGDANADDDAFADRYAMDPDRGAPPAEEFGATLKAITDADRPIFILYTNFVEDKLQSEKQFRQQFSAFDFSDHLTVSVRPDVDHTYSLKPSQTEVLAAIVNWFQSNWPAP